jgi:GNAT superfamily N-acetyltransferase
VKSSNEDVEVRPLGRGEEEGAYALMADTFLSNTDRPVAAAAWRRFVESTPGQHSDRVRAAFLQNRCVGTYIIDEREVWLAGTKVSASFVGVVVVQKHLRGKGIGTAMMKDSFAYSRQRGLALMALHGAPGYYTPFGYVDVFDTSGITFRRADVATFGPSLLDVRTATTGDAGAMAGLYEDAHASYSGWSVRSEAQEEHWLRHATAPPHERGELFGTPGPVVAVDKHGNAHGYLRHGWGPFRSFGCEVAATSPEAVMSLAAYHSALRGPLQSWDDAITWQLPPGSLTAELLGDCLPVTVGSEHRPSEGWMAAVADEATLVRQLAEPGSKSGVITGGFSVRVGDAQGLVGRPGPEPSEVAVDEATLLPLLFGYRQPDWARLRPGCVVPRNPDVDAFLTNRPWIPPSNGW